MDVFSAGRIFLLLLDYMPNNLVHEIANRMVVDDWQDRPSMSDVLTMLDAADQSIRNLALWILFRDHN